MTLRNYSAPDEANIKRITTELTCSADELAIDQEAEPSSPSRSFGVVAEERGPALGCPLSECLGMEGRTEGCREGSSLGLMSN